MTQQQLADFKKQVRTYTYSVCDPLSIVYDLIDDLQLMGEAADTPYLETQLVSYALEILRSTGDFQDGIKA